MYTRILHIYDIQAATMWKAGVKINHVFCCDRERVP